jgi:hypothetical protein
MGEARNGEWTGAKLLAWPIAPVAGNPLFAVVTDINSKLLESVVRAQKDWAEFVHQRVQEDIAASRRLVKCQSLTDMQQIYSQYFQTAFEQYREQSERAFERGKSMTEAVVQNMEFSSRETNALGG